MIPQEVLGVYLAANAFALLTLASAFWRRSVARWISVGVFVWAACINTWTVLTDPRIYVAYADLTPSSVYRDFILGWFSQHITSVVLPIAAGQATIAVLLALPSTRVRRLGAAGAVVFLLAIAPLGVGAGFPFSLTFGAAVALSVSSEGAWSAVETQPQRTKTR